MISRPPALSARTRLTLWYVALLATTLVGLGSLGFWLVRRELYDNADYLLRSKAVAVITEIEIEDGRLVFDNADDDHNDADEDASLMVGLDVVRIWDVNRQLISTIRQSRACPTWRLASTSAILAAQAGDGVG